MKSSSSDSSQAVEENSVVNQAEQFGKALEQVWVKTWLVCGGDLEYFR